MARPVRRSRPGSRARGFASRCSSGARRPTFAGARRCRLNVAKRLRALGHWDSFRALDPVPLHGAQGAKETNAVDEHSFAATPDDCGWLVDRATFDTSLRALAIGAGASVHSCVNVRDLRRSAEGFTLAIDGTNERNTAELRARVVVDASGRSAFVAQRLGSVRRRCDNLVGIALRFDRHDDAAPATIEPASLGWWYSSSIPGSRTVAVFLTDADLLTRTFVADTEGWRTLLAGAPRTAARIGSANPLGNACAFAAATHVLDRAAGEGWLAVGDVAIGRDAIFGSGIDFALASAELAAHTVVRAFGGCCMAWREYDARISRDAQAYLEERARYYEETRWPDAPFWRRRHGWRAAA